MKSKVLVLGTGLVGAHMAIDLAKDDSFIVHVADISEKRLKKLDAYKNIVQHLADVSKSSELAKLVSGFDYILNATPGYMGFATLKQLIRLNKNVVDISFFPEDPFELDELAIQNNVTALVDCGLAPGMSYMLAAHSFYQMDTCSSIEIYVGGLPKIRTLPFEYKAVFSPIDVIEEYTRPARYIKNGQLITKEALSEAELMTFDGVGTLEAFNTDGLRTMLKTISCPNMIEKTLRYPGHIDKIKLLKEIGFFSSTPVHINGTQVKPIDLSSQLLFPMWELKDGEEDITVMKIIASGNKDQKNIRHEWNLLDQYDSVNKVHSMARTTGYTATMALRMLKDKLFTATGIIPPEYIAKQPGCVDYILDGLKKRNINYKLKIEKND